MSKFLCFIGWHNPETVWHENVNSFARFTHQRCKDCGHERIVDEFDFGCSFDESIRHGIKKGFYMGLNDNKNLCDKWKERKIIPYSEKKL